jgi:IclR family mhp operon transcriptional activator
VERSFAVLKAMNENTLSRITELQDRTGLPAATVVRILETLVSLGYVRNHGRRVGYTLTEKVLELSSGYHGLPLFLENAKQVLLELTAAIRWPAALATLGDTAMVVRLSTIPESPLAHTHSTLQKRLDLLTRAHGRAYLAFCPDEERAQLYQRLHEEGLSRLSAPELEARMHPVLSQIRQLGFAERDHEIDPQTTTVAIPVFLDGQLQATIGVTFFRGAKADRSAIIAGMQHAADKLKHSAPGTNFNL